MVALTAPLHNMRKLYNTPPSREVVIIYVVKATSTHDLIYELESANIGYQEIHFLGLTVEERLWLVKELMNISDDIYEVVARRSNPFKAIEDRFEDMTTLEVVEYIANNPRCLRAPIVINSYRRGHFGKKYHGARGRSAEAYLRRGRDDGEDYSS